MAASAKSDRLDCGVPGEPNCACRAAVVKAFNGMTRSGAPYDEALEAATRVFLYHHPELGWGARELIERWISPESLH
jgi:hypothetical protein